MSLDLRAGVGLEIDELRVGAGLALGVSHISQRFEDQSTRWALAYFPSAVFSAIWYPADRWALELFVRPGLSISPGIGRGGPDVVSFATSVGIAPLFRF